MNRPEDWAMRAVCADPDVDPDDFFNEAEFEHVRQLCLRCPVRKQCLKEFAHDQYAFAGGLSPDERRAYVVTGELPSPPPPPELRVEPTQRERILALIELGAGYDLICKRMSVPFVMVKHLADRAGVVAPERPPTKWRGKSMSALARQTMIGLYLGETPAVIGDRLNCHAASVAKVKARLMYNTE